jgi:cytochrome b6-f complex iron-sulfur subunit
MADKKISRRDFLGLSLVIGGAIAITETLFVGLRFLSPKKADGEFGGTFNLGAYDQFPLGSVTPVEKGRFYIVRLQDGGFLAVYRRCTHLGCSVPYDQATQQFICPCHGSAFSMQGDVKNPPAVRPLNLFSLSITDTGDLLVNTESPIERDQFGPEQIIYG